MTHFLIGAQSLMLSLNDAFFDRCPVTDVVICYNFYKSVCPVIVIETLLCRILTIVYKGDLISIMTIHELSLCNL
jgi:hypothetical protein